MVAARGERRRAQELRRWQGLHAAGLERDLRAVRGLPEKDESMKVTPFLWFDGQAEEAARFYASVFRKAKVGKPVQGPDGKVMVVPFEIEGQPFTALNGGPQFKFNEAVSFVVHCKDQDEVDYYWDKLSSGGGHESMCGWLKDRYGLSWQVVPEVLPE